MKNKQQAQRFHKISGFYILLIFCLLSSLPKFVKAQCFTSISLRALHAGAIATDESLWCWGANSWAQLGDSSTAHRFTPTRIGVNSRWHKIVTGSFTSFAIKNDGSLWAWGASMNGVAGIDTNLHPLPAPTQVGKDTNWRDVSPGFNHSLGIKNDGTLWAWGRNQRGEVGDGTTVIKYTPVLVSSSNDWKQIQASNTYLGLDASLAIRLNGTLWGWGSPSLLGDTSFNNSILVPTQIGTDSNWLKVVFGENHCIALKTDSSLWTWGNNAEGALGDSTPYYRRWPKQIMPNTKFIDIAAWGTSLAVRSDGIVVGCGRNTDGQLGLGDTLNRFSFTPIGYTGSVKQINVGHCSVILDTNGIGWACGLNQYGACGDGTFINRKTFVQTKSDFCQTLSADETFALPFQLSIFPSPARQKITVVGLPNKAKYVIVNPQGSILLQGQSLDNSTTIDVSSLASGLYFLTSIGHVQRFVKE
jgi:alpha-tubulin suppressor-like RCC1 family protein